MLAVAVALLIAPSSAIGPPRTTGVCKWVQGRFNVWNGSGVRRIWLMGTHRLVALYDADENVPKAIYDYVYSGPFLVKADGLFGEFRVCALEPSRKGHMQHVRITAVRHLTFRGQPFPPIR